MLQSIHNAAAKLTFSGPGKSALRSAITSNPGWQSYSRSTGKTSADLTVGDLLGLASAFGIDPAPFATGQFNEGPKPMTHDGNAVFHLKVRFENVAHKMADKPRRLCKDIFATSADKQNGCMTARQYETIASICHAAETGEAPRFYKGRRRRDAGQYEAPPAVPVATPPASPVVTPPPVNPPLAGDAAAQLAALLASIAGQSLNADAVGAIVDARINAALAAIPSVRIDVKGFDGEVRALDGHKHPRFAQLLKAATSRMANGYAPNVWLAGPAGSGKTHAGHQLADALGLPFHLNGALSMPHELLGFIDAGGTYHATPFRAAYENGGVYMFDEVDGSDNAALLALNAALANGHAAFPDKAVKRHANCVILASANTWGLGATADYVGRTKIDAAFLSRFPVRLAWDYDTALEVAISGNEAFARRVIAARERARAAGLKVLIDPRASQAGAALIANGMAETEAAELTYLANLSAEQRRLVEGV